MSPRPRRVSAKVFPRILAAVVATAAVAAVAPQCSSDRSADGAPCTSPFDCSSGLCLRRSATVSVCAHVCASDGDCSAGDVCGRYDFSIPDDSGVLAGDSTDQVLVCRPSTRVSCASGCGPSACLSLGAPTDGECALPCTANGDCPSTVCLRVPGACGGLCAPSCDSLAECPRYFLCDHVHTDAAGHGRCVPVDPDAGIASTVGDASCGVDL